MPSSINGIGTTYFGKKNVATYRGVCESCQREVMLEDYETGHFICVIFIPLIPLGRKQIVGYCSSCTQHRSIPLAEWERVREESIDQGMSDLADNQDDPEAALKLLETLTAFNQREQADDLADATQSSHPKNVDVQLALGSWYEQTEQPEKATRCFDQAFEVDPTHPGAIRARGIGLLEKGDLDAAKAMLEQLAPPSEHYDPGVFFVLATSFQSAERHQEAVELLELVQASSPEAAKDKSFRKALKKSTKKLR